MLMIKRAPVHQSSLCRVKSPCVGCRSVNVKLRYILHPGRLEGGGAPTWSQHVAHGVTTSLVSSSFELNNEGWIMAYVLPVITGHHDACQAVVSRLPVGGWKPFTLVQKYMRHAHGHTDMHVLVHGSAIYVHVATNVSWHLLLLGSSLHARTQGMAVMHEVHKLNYRP